MIPTQIRFLVAVCILFSSALYAENGDPIFQHQGFPVHHDLLIYIANGQGFVDTTFLDGKENKVIGAGRILQMNTSSINNRYERDQIYEYNHVAINDMVDRQWGFVDHSSILNGTNRLSSDMAANLLINDTKCAINTVQSIFPRFDEISYPRQVALIDMAYNLGENKFRNFKGMILAVKKRDWAIVAKEMEESLWFNQVKSRSIRNVAAVRSNRRKNVMFKAERRIENSIKSVDSKEKSEESIKIIYEREMNLVFSDIDSYVADVIKITRPGHPVLSERNKAYEQYSRMLHEESLKDDCKKIEKLRDIALGKKGELKSFLDWIKRNPEFTSNAVGKSVLGAIVTVQSIISQIANGVCKLVDIEIEALRKAEAEAAAVAARIAEREKKERENPGNGSAGSSGGGNSGGSNSEGGNSGGCGNGPGKGEGEGDGKGTMCVKW